MFNQAELLQFPILRYFGFEHLPAKLQGPSNACATLAKEMIHGVVPNAELSAGLRKLLEAKDCFVRSNLGQ